MLELLKHELKELPEWAMHALRVPQRKNQVINFKFKDIGSAVAALKLELREETVTMQHSNRALPLKTKHEVKIK